MLPRGRKGRLLLVLVLLLFAIGVGWRFRPLTAAERRLVGTWRFDHPALSTFVLVTLAPDRTYSETVLFRSFPQKIWQASRGYTGTWTSSTDRLWLRQSPPGPRDWSHFLRRCRQLLSGELRWQELSFEVDADGRGAIAPKGGTAPIPFSRMSDPDFLRVAADPVGGNLPATSSAAQTLDELLPPMP